MTPEKIFLMYAYPCLENLYYAGKIKENVFMEIVNKFANNLPISKKQLEDLLPKAFDRMNIAFKGKYFWTVEKVREYWKKYHNGFLRQENGLHNKGNKVNAYICEVKFSRVIGFDGKKAIVSYRRHDPNIDKNRSYFNSYGHNLKVKDYVFIHRNLVIEKADKKDLQNLYIYR